MLAEKSKRFERKRKKKRKCFIDTMVKRNGREKRKSEREMNDFFLQTQFYHLTTEMLHLKNFTVLSSSPVSLAPSRGLMILYIEGLLGSWQMVIMKVKVTVKVIGKLIVKVKVIMKVKVTVYWWKRLWRQIFFVKILCTKGKFTFFSHWKKQILYKRTSSKEYR